MTIGTVTTEGGSGVSRMAQLVKAPATKPEDLGFIQSHMDQLPHAVPSPPHVGLG